MLRPTSIEPVPPETAHIARAAFPKGNRYLRVADELDTLFTDDAFLALFPTHGQPAQPPWQLALVTILQFAEGLSDRQAAHAVRSRIDWKYVLRLELADPGFDASVLSEFRGRLIAGAAEYLLFDTLLTWCRSRQLVKARAAADGLHPHSRRGAGLEPPRGGGRNDAPRPEYARRGRPCVAARGESP
jgi:transposase